MIKIKSVLTQLFIVLIIHGLVDCHPKAQIIHTQHSIDLIAPLSPAPPSIYDISPTTPVPVSRLRAQASFHQALPLKESPPPFAVTPLLLRPVNSTSEANSEVRKKQVNIDGLGVTQSTIYTKTFTKDNNGFKSIDSDSLSKTLSFGDLNLSSSISRGIENDNGSLDADSSVTTKNMKKGFGVLVDENAQSINLGLLSIDLTKDNNSNEGTSIIAKASTYGKGTETLYNSQRKIDRKRIFDIKKIQSKSKTIVSVKNGYTDSNAKASIGKSIFNKNLLLGNKAFGFPESKKEELRPKRQIYFPGPTSSPSINRFSGGSYQNSAANSGSSSLHNEFGKIQQNGGNAISSNIAFDGSSGQISSANTAQQGYVNSRGFGNMNSAQSQSTNFGPNGQLDLSNAQSNNLFENGPNSSRGQNTAGASSLSQNQFGAASNIANSGVIQTNMNGFFNEQVNADAQSQNFNQLGNSGATSNTKTETIRGPNGQIFNSSSSSASSSSVNNGRGGNFSSNSNARSGNVNGQSFGNANSNTNIYQPDYGQGFYNQGSNNPDFGVFGGFRG